jgi:hypothetical protein
MWSKMGAASQRQKVENLGRRDDDRIKRSASIPSLPLPVSFSFISVDSGARPE